MDFSTQDIASGKALLLTFSNENSQCSEENKKNPFSVVEYGQGFSEGYINTRTNKGETSCTASPTFEFKESDNIYISLFICLIIYYDSLLFAAKVISPVTPLKHYYLVIQSNFFWTSPHLSTRYLGVVAIHFLALLTAWLKGWQCREWSHKDDSYWPWLIG